MVRELPGSLPLCQRRQPLEQQFLRRNPQRGRFGHTSIRRIDHDVLRSLGLIPGAAALLIDHAAVIDRNAPCRHGAHHRAHDGGSHGNRGADRCRRRDRVIVVVPAAVTATAAIDIDVDVGVPVDVDVVDAGAADIVGARIGLAVVGLNVLPGTAPATAGAIATAAAATTAARAAAAATTATAAAARPQPPVP